MFEGSFKDIIPWCPERLFGSKAFAKQLLPFSDLSTHWTWLSVLLYQWFVGRIQSRHSFYLKIRVKGIQVLY